MTTSVMERSSEIGLMKAIGAHNRSVVHVVLSEILLTGFAYPENAASSGSATYPENKTYPK